VKFAKYGCHCSVLKFSSVDFTPLLAITRYNQVSIGRGGGFDYQPARKKSKKKNWHVLRLLPLWEWSEFCQGQLPVFSSEVQFS